MRLSIGQLINRRYHILSLLGTGGASEVYLVKDFIRETPIVLKLITKEDSYLAHKTFENEAKALTLLDHPNIVHLYGIERWNGLPFLLMEYIDGVNLGKEIAHSRSGLENDRVFSILRQLCPALNYAHNADIIHCDIKPANILVSKDGKIFLVDFGIATSAGNAYNALKGAGTHTYMAPEQVEGRSLSVQTDIYAVGIVLYEMLTGHRPYPKEATQNQMAGNPPPSLRQYRPDILPGVEAVVLKCLNRDPAQRHESMMALYGEFERSAALIYPSKPARFQPASSTPPLHAEPNHRISHPAQGKSLAYTMIGLLFTFVFVLVIGMSQMPGSKKSTPTPAYDKEAQTAQIINQCQHFNPPWSMKSMLNECVAQVEIQADGKMKVFFEWKVISVGDEGIEIASDQDNQKMYLTDNLGNHLDFIDAGGQAIQTVRLFNGQSKTGWFLFPAPSQGAHIFSFHDDDNGNLITGIEIAW